MLPNGKLRSELNHTFIQASDVDNEDESMLLEVVYQGISNLA